MRFDPSSALPSGNARRPILLMAVGAFALGTDAFVISGVLPNVGDDLGVSLRNAGLLLTVFSGVYAVASPVIAVLTGTVRRRPLLLMSLALFVVANLVAAMTPGFELMIAARVLAAISAAIYMPTAYGCAVTLVQPEEKGRALATVLGGLTVSTATGVPIGTLLGQSVGWRSTFVFVAVLGLLSLIGLTVSLKHVPSPPVASLKDRLAVAKTPTVPAALLTTMLTVMGIFVIYAYLAWFATRTADIHGNGLTILYFVYGLASVASGLVGGWWVDKSRPESVGKTSLVGLTLTLVAVGALMQSAPSTNVARVGLYVFVIAWGFVAWLFMPSQQKRLAVAAGPQASVAMSLNASAIYAGQAIAGVIGGAMLTDQPQWLAYAAASITGLSLGIYVITTRPLKVRSTRQVHAMAQP